MIRCTFFLLLIFVCRSLTAQDSPSQRFTQLLDDVWENDLREAPLFATSVGDVRFNDQLSRESLADQQRRLAQRQTFRQRHGSIDRAQLAESERLNYDVFGQQLRDDLAELEFKTYLQPITNRSGFHVSFPELPREVPLNTVGDYENYVARLRQFDRFVADHVELMRAGIQSGHVLSSVVLEGYENALQPHVVDDPAKSLLAAPFAAFPKSFSEADKTKLTASGHAAIAQHVVPGYKAFLDFMKKEYVPASRDSLGASTLPNGREFYRHRVRMYTTLDVTPEQVHETGLAEVKRIRAEMETIIKQVKFEGTFAEFLHHLRTDPKFYATSPEQLQKEVAFILKRMDGELPRLFKTLPRTPYGLREIPAFIAPRTTSAYYNPPAGDGTRAGFYYLNTYNLKSRPLFEMEALALHEAVPGHHLQLALQQELTGLPKFRRFTSFTAYIEGWALYAERLGLETGFYQDPYSDFGRLSFEMWRACRLVVDSGIHYFGWTRERAIQYMLENTALADHNVRAEVDRYVSWPGQALAYKMGELKIRELRSYAEKELGSAFDLREFHDQLLATGSIPLPILEARIQEYIKQAASRNPKPSPRNE